MFSIGSFDEITEEAILAAASFLRAEIPPSPLEQFGDVALKFESCNPTGAFKVRGGLIYFEWLMAARPEVRSVIAATRGNHGQSVAFAAGKIGIGCRVVVPFGNSEFKNRAMRQLGAEVIEHGRDFGEALEFANAEAKRTSAHMVPSFDWKLVLGVSTYGYELFSEASDLDAVFVPIGLGSGICGTIAARNALGSTAKIIGVVAENAPAYAKSFEAGKIVVEEALPDTIADGVACRQPISESFAVIQKYTDAVVTVPEVEIVAAMRELSDKTGHRVEGAGAIAYAAWKRHGDTFSRAAVIVSGGNIDEGMGAPC